MKQIKLLSMHIQNFKGCKDRKIKFGDKTRIFGANATGKTTVFDGALSSIHLHELEKYKERTEQLESQ